MLAISSSYYAPRREERLPVGAVDVSSLPEGVECPLLLQRTEIPSGTTTVTLKNRVIVAPMCMYSSVDGFPTPFHLVHHGQFALHGAGAIVVEASGVTAAGRISPRDLGLYKEEHVAAHASLVQTVKDVSSEVYFGIQLAHAGRKASTWPPYDRTPHETPYMPASEGGWDKAVVGASAIPYGEGHLVPHELTISEVRDIEDDFVRAADRAFRAGYDFVQIHSAHGYLLSSFNSPLSNKRTDMYGGSLENRTRLLLNIVRRIREQFPEKGLWVRLNGKDALAEDDERECWDYESTTALASLLDAAGVDMLDVSSGGVVGRLSFPSEPGYQVPGAEAALSAGLRRMKVSAVGCLEGGTEENPDKQGEFAEKVLQEGRANFIVLGRIFLRQPTWVEDVARSLLGRHALGALQYSYTFPPLH